MDLRKLFLTKNACYIANQKIKPIGIMWHSTGANNPNLKRYVGPDDGALGVNIYGNHWNTARPGGKKICAHAFIGKLANGNIATYQTLPWDINGWHSGGSANNGYIGFEICEDGLNDKSYFEKVYAEAVELSAYLCEMFNLNPLGENVIICHADGAKLGIASNHGDVYHWFNKYGKTMDDVRKDVAKAMGTTTATTQTEMYRVRKSWDDAKSQIGAYRNLESAKDHADKSAGYKVFDSAGKCVYTPKGSDVPFKVRVSINDLYIMSKPGGGTRMGFIAQGVYTIVETKVSGKYNWGKLKSGIGWIALEYTKRL